AGPRRSSKTRRRRPPKRRRRLPMTWPTKRRARPKRRTRKPRRVPKRREKPSIDDLAKRLSPTPATSAEQRRGATPPENHSARKPLRPKRSVGGAARAAPLFCEASHGSISLGWMLVTRLYVTSSYC